MILYKENDELTTEGLLEDMDCKAAEILMAFEIDEDDVYKLANMVEKFYEQYHKEHTV